MGLIQKPTYKAYWNTHNPSQHTPWFIEHFSRDRFELLLKFLHFADNNKMPDKKDDAYQLYKIQQMITHFKGAFKKFYVPDKKISVDESMIGYRGRTPHLRQYMPKKQHAKFGIKYWCLCESETGYLVNFEIYRGANKSPHPVSEEGITHNLVMRLIEEADLL